MIRKVSAELKRNRSLMSQHMTPNIVKYVEFEKPGRAKNMLSRVLITQARDGMYSVGIIRVGHKLDRYACSYTPDISRHQQKYFAEEKLEELSTQLEIKGFECVDEFEAPLVDITAMRYQSMRIIAKKGITFFHDNRHEADKFMCQLVPAGLHVIVKIDAFGKVAVHDFQSENVSIDKENLITGRIRSYLKPLIQKEGFRGALMEGFLDHNNLYVVDAGFLHDKALFEVPFEQRAQYIRDIMGSLEQEDGCRFIEPVADNGTAWTSTYRFGLNKGALVKRKASLFALQPTLQFGERADNMDAGVMLTEGNIVNIMGNRVKDGVLRANIDGSLTKKADMFYPCKEELLRPNEYSVIGYDATLTVMPLII